MFDTMTMTKLGGALCGALLIYLLGVWFAETIYHAEGDHGAHGDDHASKPFVTCLTLGKCFFALTCIGFRKYCSEIRTFFNLPGTAVFWNLNHKWLACVVIPMRAVITFRVINRFGEPDAK